MGPHKDYIVAVAWLEEPFIEEQLAVHGHHFLRTLIQQLDGQLLNRHQMPYLKPLLLQGLTSYLHLMIIAALVVGHVTRELVVGREVPP